MQMNRRVFVCGAGAAAGIAAVDAKGYALLPANGDEFLQLFKSPPKKYRPLVRWWWPGDDVTEAELRREVGALDEAGFGGAEVQAFFKGLDRAALSPEQTRRINGFATPSYFEHVRVAADEARRRGLFLDCTLGSGWPFGGGDAISPELAAIELRWSHRSLVGPAHFDGRLEVPSLMGGDPARPDEPFEGLSADWAARMRKRTRVVAVVAVRGEDAEWAFYQTGPRGRGLTKTGSLDAGTAVDLTQRMREDGSLSWQVPPGTWQVFVFASMPTGQRVNGGSGEGPQLVLDHMNAEAFRAHAARVGGASDAGLAKFFGKGIRAVFCDSLEVRANLFWSDDFLAEFRRRRGYDLLPYLPVLQVQSVPEPFAQFLDTPMFDVAGEGDRVRRDYRQTVAELMKERFYDEFNRWAHGHGLLARTQAHGAPVDVLEVYGDADIPETEQLYDNGTYDFLKLAASAAHTRGRAIVGSESFVWPGALYQTTPEEMKRATDEMITAGVNAIVLHGFAYRLPGIAAPGWHPFSGIHESGNYSSQFNELNPMWPYFTRLNAYITRLQFVSQSSRNVAAVALFRDGLMHGAEESSPTPPLNQALIDAGYNYDHVNTSGLMRCTMRAGRLVSSGGAMYRALVLPEGKSLPTALREQVQRFAEAGLPVVQMDATSGEPRSVTQPPKPAGTRAAATPAECIALIERAVAPAVRFQGRPCFFAQWRAGRRDIFFLRNDSDSARDVDAVFDANGWPQLWDPWTGSVESLAVAGREKDRARVRFKLQPFGSALVVFSPDRASGGEGGTLRELTVKRVLPLGEQGWQFTARGTSHTGATVEIQRVMPSLVDWSGDAELRGFCGKGTYRSSFSAPSAEPGTRLVLDLGSVKEVAEVAVNGHPVATLLLRPFEVDITEHVKAGTNTLEVSVTNTLFNSMALREPRAFRPGPVGSVSGLMPGGLLGPVQLKVVGS